nr:immunoglobulin heavy chain junction region [Macaca mulatta]MOW89122.1 immunoglobulin heavy chain junction region [Macaca mulatta]MOW90119.1 immunoglobulin heavy chain junction region [Macaca mulatta]MOW90366.1 immunoglobulin heavy chain junction region [Macaca mulatta]MOW90875.1 immunoglobulin heavy chain junction region [Macaca mulatta]
CGREVGYSNYDFW